MAEEAAPVPRDGDAVLTQERLRETLRQIIREEAGLLQLNAEPAGTVAPPTPGKLAVFTNPLIKTKSVANKGDNKADHGQWS